MPDRLLVSVFGNRNTGKTTTWNTLFGATVNTGKHERRLYLNKAQWVNVFLVSGSPEERKLTIEQMLDGKLPTIVLCSAQYKPDVTKTFDHFFNNKYDAFVQWLNPGHGETARYTDPLGLKDYLLNSGATLQIRDGRIPPQSRVNDIRQLILGWATLRNLVSTDF